METTPRPYRIDVSRIVVLVKGSTVIGPHRSLHELPSVDVELVGDILPGDKVFDELSLHFLDDGYCVVGYEREGPYSRTVFDRPVGADAKYEIGVSVCRRRSEGQFRCKETSR
jgi:hypothetical protein